MISRIELFANRNVEKLQTLERTPEPSMDMDGIENSFDFNKAIETNIAANYAVVLSLIDRIVPLNRRQQAVDLCSGPGHFSVMLNKYLNIENVNGIEISQNMIDYARKNISTSSLTDHVKVFQGDVRFECKDQVTKVDLVTFVNSAHHMNTIEDLKRVLENAENYLNPSGILFLSDLGRLKSAVQTQKFVDLAGSEFIQKNMTALYSDFFNSMNAAWLPSELLNAIPDNSPRKWYLLVTPKLGVLQALVAVPENQDALFLQEPNVRVMDLLKSDEAKEDWCFLSKILMQSPKRVVSPNSKIGKLKSENASIKGL